ncbi:biotin/lipoyl-containing protein, partial [Streptomyces sp. CBMA156]|uniref:biotin/lipoyl-containing protein n=1 Tax=Streptomyces sp. CBMA156 TaxID=1930280 RepID=UPI001DBBC455
PTTVRAELAGAVLGFRAEPGRTVARGEPVALLRTPDGAEVPVPAPADGTVTALLAAPGEQVAPGAGLLALDETGGPVTVRLFATDLPQAAKLVPGREVRVPVPGAGTVRAVITAVDELPVRADSLTGTFAVPVPGLPGGSAPVWRAYAELPGSVGRVAGPVPLTAEVDLGARHPYQAVFGTEAGR